MATYHARNDDMFFKLSAPSDKIYTYHDTYHERFGVMILYMEFYRGQIMICSYISLPKSLNLTAVGAAPMWEEQPAWPWQKAGGQEVLVVATMIVKMMCYFLLL